MSDTPHWCPAGIWEQAEEVTSQVDAAIWGSDTDYGLDWSEAQPAVARALIAAREPLITALRTLQEAAAGYIHPERRVSAEELIDLVLATVDNQELVRAMRTSEPSNAIVDEGMETDNADGN